MGKLLLVSSGVRQADILEGAEELCAEAIDHLCTLELTFTDTEEEQTGEVKQMPFSTAPQPNHTAPMGII